MASLISTPTVGLLYSASGAGTALNTSTTATAINKSDIPAIPQANFAGFNGVPWSFHIFAAGVIGTKSATNGNFTIALYADYFQGTPMTVLCSSVAQTPTAAISAAPWSLDIYVAAYSNGTVMSNGSINGIAGYLSGIGTASAVALPAGYPVYFDLVATWATSDATNTITCQQYQIYGNSL